MPFVQVALHLHSLPNHLNRALSAGIATAAVLAFLMC